MTDTTTINDFQPILVEVCQGPNCAGGAALLEIEELVQEELQGIPISTIVGGCRDLCTVGPNVHIRRGKTLMRSFHHVDDTSTCYSVVQSVSAVSMACDTSTCNYDYDSSTGHLRGIKDQDQRIITSMKEGDSATATTTTTNSHQSMMERRAERMRWEALRQVSRTIAKCKKEFNNSSSVPVDSQKMQNKINNLKESCARHLSPARQADLAASKVEIHQDRAKRRADRLMRNITKRLEECFQEEASDDDCESSSNDSIS